MEVLKKKGKIYNFTAQDLFKRNNTHKKKEKKIVSSCAERKCVHVTHKCKK